MAIFSDNTVLETALAAMVNELKSVYGSLLTEIILYGSYARGTQTDESDVDIALILADKPTREATDAMRAVNALDGFDSSKHSGVIAHFNQMYVKMFLRFEQ